ncbi:TPA: hypothetical protein L9024_000458 [Klebsiella pneumoniae]|nr:hypothetical protein [Klebsiella pneumoniae]HCB0969912.1 hypothetical protein [Klebsiella pneumoniae]HCB1249725.1 hypothetical protein [Klebsiella pneumoniae]
MIDYNPARKEIAAAKKCLDTMRLSRNLDEMDQLWRNCINHIEKSHTKLLSATKSIKEKFSSTFEQQFLSRKNDPLLKYIKQARDSDNHSIADISKKVNSCVAFSSNPAANKPTYIKKIIIMEDGLVCTEFSGDPPQVDFIPERIVVVPVTNRGYTFHPPCQHLGEEVLTNSPIEIARNGILFYEKWIDLSGEIFP